MTEKHKRVIEISSDNPNTLEKVYHELLKAQDQASRYGENVSVRRVNTEDKEVVGFDE